MPNAMTKQRQLQLRYKAEGRCEKCGEPSPERSYCDACAARNGTKKRNPLPSEWAAVDWRMQSRFIAEQLGVSVTCVCMHRRLNAPHTARSRGLPAKLESNSKP